jgi:hypothetical protein
MLASVHQPTHPPINPSIHSIVCPYITMKDATFLGKWVGTDAPGLPETDHRDWCVKITENKRECSPLV